MDTTSPTPPPEKDDSPALKTAEEVSTITSPVDSDFMPPVTKKPSKYRYIWLVIIIGLVISVVGVGAHIIDSESRRPSSQISALTTPTPVVSRPPITPTPDLTVDWQTYTSESLGFSVKLPKDWTIQGPTRTDPTIYFKSTATLDGPYIWVVAYTNPNNLPFEDMATEGLGKEIKDTFTSTKEPLGNYFVYKTESIPSRSGAVTAFITQDESKYISLSLTPFDKQSPYSDQEKYLALFNQMLTTFRFVSSQSATPTGTLR